MATDIISYLQSVGARKSSGSEWVMNCPFCSKSLRLYVNTEEGEGWDGKPRPAGRFICFSCSERSMHFAKLLGAMEGISFDAARNMMGHWKAGGYNWTRATDLEAEIKAAADKTVWLPEEFEPTTKIWPKYLDTRGISRTLAADFNLGVCRTGDFADRIILPIDCPLGRDFQARAIPEKMEPRYLSGPDCGQLIFGWHTIESSDFAVIVEGPFDALSLARHGYPVGAIMGTSLRDGQRDLLKKRHRRYVVMLDPLAKDPLAVDKACDIAWKLGGLVGNNLDSPIDPGDERDKANIDRWIATAIPPREALQVALAARITRQMR